jgi:cytoskeletal protein CcmA (bactofilin family)
MTTKNGNGRPADGRGSVIDQGAVFKGTITASSNVVVRGVLEGEVTGPGLEVDSTGVVVGHAKVTRLRSSGELEGTYEAEQAEVFGRLRDGVLIRADSLTVANSEEDTSAHVFFGECELEIGPLPSQEQAVSEALALAAASVAAPAPSAPSGMDLGSQMANKAPFPMSSDADTNPTPGLPGARGQKKNPADLKPAAGEILERGATKRP